MKLKDPYKGWNLITENIYQNSHLKSRTELPNPPIPTCDDQIFKEKNSEKIDINNQGENKLNNGRKNELDLENGIFYYIEKINL